MLSKEHALNVDDAKKYGITEALILHSIRYYVEYHRTNLTNIKNGRAWTYNSYRAFSKQFPYLTEYQIRYALNSLVTQGALLVGTFNKMKKDKTRWYSVNESWAEIKVKGTGSPKLHDDDFDSPCDRGLSDDDFTNHTDEDLPPIEDDIYELFDGENLPVANFTPPCVKIHRPLPAGDVPVVPTRSVPISSRSNIGIEPPIVKQPIEAYASHERLVADHFNQQATEARKTGSKIPNARDLTPKRLSRIRKLSKTRFKTIEEWDQYFAMVFKSKKHRGQNGIEWAATFDWILKEEKIIELLEKNHSVTGSNKSTMDRNAEMLKVIEANRNKRKQT